MSFKLKDQQGLLFSLDREASFHEDVQFVVDGASENPSGSASVVFGDSRALREVLAGTFYLVITSTPYANRMSYIRELRPYMHWLDFFENGRDAGELDWTAIGGTWGIATSLLADWEPSDKHFNRTHLTGSLQAIAHTDNNNGALLAKQVAKYFGDMWSHFCELPELPALGAELHYIVGNSNFYGKSLAEQGIALYIP